MGFHRGGAYSHKFSATIVTKLYIERQNVLEVQNGMDLKYHCAETLITNRK